MVARVFAVSDIHVDFDANFQWVRQLSRADYRDDILILAGDVTHKLAELASCLNELAARFAKVLFVPGNHDVWVLGEAPTMPLDILARSASPRASSSTSTSYDIITP